MNRYRKKPVEIEAVRVPPLSDIEGLIEFQRWVKSHDNQRKLTWSGGGLDIATLEGVMHANEGDFIIRGVAGELYPCKPDIFAATYEEVVD